MAFTDAQKKSLDQIDRCGLHINKSEIPLGTGMSPNLLSREAFRRQCLERDNGTCVVPWCSDDADEVHHIIERKLWSDEGYYMRNGASVCNPHHRLAEEDIIPPHAFWNWIGLEPLTPENLPTNITKWGDELDVPPWKELKEYIKYPSTGHLPFSPEHEHRRNDHQSVSQFADIPLVVLVKMDGSNATLVKDYDAPVRARNGSHADHESFDMLKQLYYEKDIHNTLPEHLQVAGEWLYAKHSIHYTDSDDCDCEDQGPALRDWFQVFGVFDTRYDLWLSWPAVERWADRIGFPTVPVVETGVYEEWELWNGNAGQPDLETLAKNTVNQGHEGIVIRSKHPYHYGQFEQRLSKYVRNNHVKTEQHWSHGDVTPNETRE